MLVSVSVLESCVSSRDCSPRTGSGDSEDSGRRGRSLLSLKHDVNAEDIQSSFMFYMAALERDLYLEITD